MSIDVRRRTSGFFGHRQLLVLMTAVLALMLSAGMRGRIFPPGELNGGPGAVREDAGAADRAGRSAVALEPAQLVHLPPGSLLENGDSPPEGWTHLAMKSVPVLTTGDLDTVAPQSFHTARRIRPLIVAEVRRSLLAAGPTFHLVRVGLGLCAPSTDGLGDRVISPTSLEGTQGPWNAKERIILAAMAFEVSRSTITAATPTFALVRSPNTFLVDGSHRSAETAYALLVDPLVGSLRVLVWRDGARAANSEVEQTEARLLATPVFECPLDVHASRVLGTPIAWSFAIRQLPPGRELTFPRDLTAAVRSGSHGSTDAATLELEIRRCLGGQN